MYYSTDGENIFNKLYVYFRKEWEINLTIWHTFLISTRKIAHWEIAPQKIVPYPNPNPNPNLT